VKNSKILVIVCLFSFIGCSDYMEFAEREYQAERDVMIEKYEEEGFEVFSGKDEMEDADSYKDNPTIIEEASDQKSSDEKEQGYSPMEAKEDVEVTKQDLEESTRKSEKPEERRKSYWDRMREMEQNN